MAEAWTPTLQKKFRSKKKCKASDLKAILGDEEPVPEQYAMAAQMAVQFSQQECDSIGALAKWIMTTFKIFYMKEDAYDAANMVAWKPYYLNCRDFVRNYIFPIQGINLCVVNMCGVPIICTTQPAAGLGSGPTNLDTKELQDVQLKLTGNRMQLGYVPSTYSFVDAEGNEQTQSDTGEGSLFDLMCNCDRFTTQEWTSANAQSKWKDVVQATVIPFCGIPDFKVVKKEQFGSSMRMLGMQSEKHHEALCAYKFGLTQNQEYGYIILNCADRGQTDALRMKKGTFRTAGFKLSECLKHMSELELFDVDDNPQITPCIPAEFNAALDVFEANGAKECKYDQDVWDGKY